MSKYVYKNLDSEKRIHDFYDKTLNNLKIDYHEQYIETSFGKTHLLTIGSLDKPAIFTLHGGNGIKAPLFIIASNEDIFFPANKVFAKAKKLFQNVIITKTIEGNHLPSQKTMNTICKEITAFLLDSTHTRL